MTKKNTNRIVDDINEIEREQAMEADDGSEATARQKKVEAMTAKMQEIFDRHRNKTKVAEVSSDTDELNMVSDSDNEDSMLGEDMQSLSELQEQEFEEETVDESERELDFSSEADYGDDFEQEMSEDSEEDEEEFTPPQRAVKPVPMAVAKISIKGKNLDLKAVRESLGLTQQQMAKKLKSSQCLISQVEKGKMKLSSKLASKIEKLLTK